MKSPLIRPALAALIGAAAVTGAAGAAGAAAASADIKTEVWAVMQQRGAKSVTTEGPSLVIDTGQSRLSTGSLVVYVTQACGPVIRNDASFGGLQAVEFAYDSGARAYVLRPGEGLDSFCKHAAGSPNNRALQSLILKNLKTK